MIVGIKRVFCAALLGMASLSMHASELAGVASVELAGFEVYRARSNNGQVTTAFRNLETGKIHVSRTPDYSHIINRCQTPDEDVELFYRLKKAHSAQCQPKPGLLLTGKIKSVIVAEDVQ